MSHTGRRALVAGGIVAVTLAFCAGAVSAKVRSDTKSPAAPSSVSQNAKYPANDNGQSFGGLPSVDGGTAPIKDFPDLISVVGDNGVEGYIDAEVLLGGPPPSSPEEALASSGEPQQVPVYASDGKTVVDTFTVGGSYPDPPPPGK